MQNAMHLRRNILQSFWIVSVLLVFFLAVVVYQIWQNNLFESKSHLARDAEIVSKIIDSALIDQSKILDIARRRLEVTIQDGSFTPHHAYKTLATTSEESSPPHTVNSLNILFCTDAQGNIVAFNSRYQNLNFSDQPYFKDLKAKPYKKIAIGSLADGMLNGKKFFYIAMPLKGRRGNFSGVVARQIPESDLSSELKLVIDGVSEISYIYSADEKIIIAYPESALSNFGLRLNSRNLINLVKEQKKPSGALEISGTEINQPYDIYVGYAWLSSFDLYVITTTPKPLIVRKLLQVHKTTIIYGLITFILSIWLFFRLHRQAIYLEASQYKSAHDELSGLNNRRVIIESLARLWRDSMRHQKPISALFMDIDHFKQVNDTYGHEIGDLVIKDISKALEESLHRPQDLCCRWGGEEFVAILPQTSQFEAIIVAERIMTAVRALKIFVADTDIGPVSVSIGIASITVNPKNMHENLIDMADKAMLQAKAEGRNRWAIFSQMHGQVSLQ